MRYILIILLALQQYCLFAQNNLVANPSFEIPNTTQWDGWGTFACCSQNEREEYWQGVPGWTIPERPIDFAVFCQAVGSPDIHTPGDGCSPAHTGLTFTHQITREYVVSESLDLIAGHEYFVGFYIKSAYPRVLLGTPGIKFTSDKPQQCSFNALIGVSDHPTIGVPDNIQTLLNCEKWTFYSEYYIPNENKDYLTLGMFDADFDEDNESAASLFFDDIMIFDLGFPCPDYRLIENVYYIDLAQSSPEEEAVPLVYKAGVKIVAGYDANNLETQNGNVVVQDGSDITYRAGQQIDLLPGFHVEAGANFHAYIAPCDCPPLIADAGPDWSVCGQPYYQLFAHTESYTNYTWSAQPPQAIEYLSNPNIHNPVFTTPATGSGTIIFTLTVTNQCQDYPQTDQVVISYTAQPDHNPEINLTNIDDGDFISFDMNFSPNTEEITVEVLDWNGNSLNPPLLYTYNSGTDFTCCSEPWEIPVYLTACNDYKIRVKSRNICSQVYDTEIIPWVRDNMPISLDFMNNSITPFCGYPSDFIQIQYQGAEHYAIDIRKGNAGMESFYISEGDLDPSGIFNVWDGSCNQNNCDNNLGDENDGSYFYNLRISSPCRSEQEFTGYLLANYCEGSGKTDETNDTTAINQQHLLQESTKVLISEGVKIIPNPNNGIFTVQTNSIDAESLIVQNMLGHTVYQNQNNPAKNIEIDLRDFSVGVYVVKVQTPSGQIFVEKVVYK